MGTASLAMKNVRRQHLPPKYGNSGGTAHPQSGELFNQGNSEWPQTLSQPLPCQEMTVYANGELLPLWLKLQNGTGEKVVITDQKHASCPHPSPKEWEPAHHWHQGQRAERQDPSRSP